MDVRVRLVSCAVGAVAFGLIVGLDTVRAMDPLPQFVPAKPRAPYETPYAVPADLNAYPVAVVFPAEHEVQPQAVDASYDPDEEIADARYAADALVTSDVPSEVEIAPLAPTAQDATADLQ